jgi:hypothetical protein
MVEKRIDSIDFWRGVALAVVLVNHIPGNILGDLTPRNFGFSDAAEIFVFLSGVSVYLAYGRRFGQGRDLAVVRAIFGRVVRLYGAHIALTAAAIALYGTARYLGVFDFVRAECNCETPFIAPAASVVEILGLRHQLPFFNILPLYIALLAVAPPLLALVRACGPAVALVVSVVIYALARALGVNLPSWPESGGWYFNPFAWQLMFTIGIVCGVGLAAQRLPFWPVAHRCAQFFTVSAALVVSNGFGFLPGLVDQAGTHLDWGKTELGLVRIIDFLAIAYVIYCSSATDRARSTPVYAFFCRLGRNALAIFCVGSFLSGLGQVLRDAGFVAPLFDVFYVAASLLTMYAIAGFLENTNRRAFARRGVREDRSTNLAFVTRRT